MYVSSAAPSIRLGNNATFASRTNEVVIGLATSSNNYLTGTVAGDGVIFVDSPNSGTARSLIFGTGATAAERMRIDSSGKVGIGTTSPAERLHVDRGNLKFTGETAPGAPNVATGSSTFSHADWDLQISN